MCLCSHFLEEYYIGESFEMSLAVKSKENKVLMLLPNKEGNFENFKRQKIMFIITFFTLINDLQERRKIYMIGDSDNEGLLGPSYSEKISFTPDLDSLISNTFFKFIMVTQDLVEFVERGFKADEEIRHVQTIRISKIGIWTAILLGLTSLILTLILNLIETILFFGQLLIN